MLCGDLEFLFVAEASSLHTGWLLLIRLQLGVHSQQRGFQRRRICFVLRIQISLDRHRRMGVNAYGCYPSAFDSVMTRRMAKSFLIGQ